MSFQYYNYYDDDSDVDNAATSSSDEGELPPESIVLSDGKTGKKKRFRLSKSRSRSSSRESANRHSEPKTVSDSAGEKLESDSSASGMEEEMEKELDLVVQAAHAEYDRQIFVSGPLESSQPLVKLSGQKNIENSSKTTDEDQLDSEEESAPITYCNDDLLYDPKMDEADEKWMDNIRLQYQPQTTQSLLSSGRTAVKLPNSDAVLNCPACMTLLCVDCQRHALYSHQYRAMFVFHCRVDHAQLMRYTEKPHKAISERKSRKQMRLDSKQDESASTSEQQAAPASDSHDLFCPVYCSVCNTCVAMFDVNEVYHFFNVLASHA